MSLFEVSLLLLLLSSSDDEMEAVSEPEDPVGESALGRLLR